MLLSFFFQLFLSQSEVSKDIAFLQQAQQVSAANETRQYISGTDFEFDLPYQHSLPIQDLSNQNPIIPKRIPSNSLGIIPTAQAVIVKDHASNEILFEKNNQEQRSIASITKLMTAYVLLKDQPNLQEIVTIQTQDYREGGRIRMYSGEELTYKDVLSVGLIASDNVAMAALVRHAGYTTKEFAEKMNESAKELGMNDSSFVEPTGINAQNISTAFDITLLLNAVMENDDLKTILSSSSYEFTIINKDLVRYAESTNKLYNSYINQDPYKIYGGKTGFTYEAGYCLTVQAYSSEHDAIVDIVVLGSDTLPNRFNDAKGLIDWVFSNYTWSN